MMRAAVLMCLLVAGVASAQDPLESVRALYASADYEEALSALERLNSDTGDAGENTPGTAREMEIDRYRMLCLLALGRTDEANQTMERMLLRDPLYTLPRGDASPRVHAAFAEVRQRVLPAHAQTTYAEAKRAFEQKAFAAAAQKFELTLQVIDSLVPAAGGNLPDIRTLASGFLELSRASLPAASAGATPVTTQPLAASPEKVAAPIPTQPSAASAGAPRASGPHRNAYETTSRPDVDPRAPPQPDAAEQPSTAQSSVTGRSAVPGRIAGEPSAAAPRAAEPGATPAGDLTRSAPIAPGGVEHGGRPARSTPPDAEPIIVRQTLPPWTFSVGGNFDAVLRGAIEVEIDERGNVVGAAITQPVHPLYDSVLLKASRDWKYQPAQRGGQPAKSRKRIEVVLRTR
jgi:hypothetical protein